MSNTEWPARGCELYGHMYIGKSACRQCGSPYVELTEIERRIAGAVKYHLHDEAGRDEHAERVARNVSKALMGNMATIWGVTRYEPSVPEGIVVIELFATEDLATAFRDGFQTRMDLTYAVTKFRVWNGPIDSHAIT